MGKIRRTLKISRKMRAHLQNISKKGCQAKLKPNSRSSIDQAGPSRIHCFEEHMNTEPTLPAYSPPPSNDPLKIEQLPLGAQRVPQGGCPTRQPLAGYSPPPSNNQLKNEQLPVGAQGVPQGGGQTPQPNSTGCKNQFVLKGKRIVDIGYYFEQIKAIAEHESLHDCKFSYVDINKEMKVGLYSKFNLSCKLCNQKFSLETSRRSQKKADVNQEAVAGIISIGSGYTHMQYFLASLDISCFSAHVFKSFHDTIFKWWEKTAAYSMAEAAREEAEYARKIGRLNEDGIPMITVAADGCWSKRSYGSNGNASSGAAAIIGLHTKKVLYYGVKNKFCHSCSVAAGRGVQPDRHHCFRNYEGESYGMESMIIVEGFRKSIEQGLIYSDLIVDGDSTNYTSIVKSRPYDDFTVRKANYTYHVLRNYTKALLELSTNRLYPAKHRKLVKSRHQRLHWAVTHSVRHWNASDIPLTDQIKNITVDIVNSPYHIFGDHGKCATYFCKPEEAKSDVNLVIDLQTSGIFEKLCDLSHNLSSHSDSLVYNSTANIVKSFKGRIAKYVGGKRINYSTSNSYYARCAAAVVAHNLGSLLSPTHKHVFNCDANDSITKLEALIIETNKANRKKENVKGRKVKENDSI